MKLAFVQQYGLQNEYEAVLAALNGMRAAPKGKHS